MLSAAVAICVFWRFTADDAYIVARYSMNLATGHGLVFNTGEPVSALTSPAEALILAALSGWQLPALTLYKLLNALTVGTSLYLVSYIAFSDLYQRTMFLALTALSPFVIMWTVGGLETPLLLVAATWLALLCVQPISPRSLCLAALLGSVGFLIRYDSVLFTAPIVLTMGWHLYRTKRLVALHCGAILLPALLLPVGWLIFTYRYYGNIFPTSFYLKAPHFGLSEVLRGGGYEVSALILSGLWLGAPAIVRRFRHGRLNALTFSSRNLAIALSTGIILVLLYGLSAGTKHMMFGYRLFVPYLPAIALGLIRMAPVTDRRAAQKTIVAVGVLQACLIYVVWHFIANPTLAFPWRQYEYSRLSLHSLAYDFLDEQEYEANSIVAHWRALSSLPHRPPRIATYAGGRVPYLIQDAYIYESLVSYRRHCARRWAQFADYVMIVYPLHGELEDQLGDVAVNGLKIVDRVLRFDGSLEHFEVWYNPQPKAFILPARISGSCAGE